MVRSILFATVAVCIANTAIAQAADTTFSSVFLRTDDELRNELIDRLFSGSNEDISTAQSQLYLDDLGSSLRSQSGEDILKVPFMSRLDAITHRNRINAFAYAAKQYSFTLRTRATIDPDLANTPNYENHYYRGSPFKTSTSMTIETNDLAVSVTQSKSPGEPIFFDHLVASLSLNHALAMGFGDLRLEQFCLGDYSLSYGNGLALSTGYPQVPSMASVSSPMLYGQGIEAYTSTSSYRYFQGGAASLASEHFTLDLFFSDRNIDAEIDSEAITYLPQSGYHRTTLELDRRNTARQKTGGAAFGYRSSDSSVAAFRAGVVGYSTDYDHPLALSDSNAQNFGVEHLTMASAYVQSVMGKIEVDGEYAEEHSNNGWLGAFAVTAIADPFEKLRFTMNYHHLPAKFYSPFGGTFGIGGNTIQNDNGFYAGLRYAAISKLVLFAYASTAKTTSSSQASYTTEARLGMQWKGQRTTIDALTRYVVSSSTIKPRYELRTALTHRFTPSLELSLKAQYRTTSDSVSAGYSILFGARYKPMPGLRVSFVVEPFHSDSFSSRLFSAEPDLPGNITLTQLYGSGTRYQLSSTFDPMSHISVSAFFGETIYSYPLGAADITKTMVGVQCDIRL